MTGPEHYAEAERLLDEVLGNNTNPQITYAEDAAQLAAAQVHATLAQVAYLREIGDQLDTFPRNRPLVISS